MTQILCFYILKNSDFWNVTYLILRSGWTKVCTKIGNYHV